MGSLDTMTLLGKAFVELAESRPFEKISVSDIVAAAGKNRKTFYYHFEGKDNLVHWIFRKDLADILIKEIDEAELVHEKPGAHRYPELPYYVRRKSGVRSLDGTAFSDAMATCLQTRRSFYVKALRQNGPESLMSYLKGLYRQAFADDVRFILSNRYLADSSVTFLAEFYSGALLTYLADKTCDLSCNDILADVRPFQNTIHSSLESEIKKQQLKRVL